MINVIHTNGIQKQGIIDLFNDCDICIHVEEQMIIYYKGNWVDLLGTYNLKNKRFIYNWLPFYKFFEESISYNDQIINKLLRPIIEEAIKRKITTVI